MQVTLWRLRDPAGVATRCALVALEGALCELRLERGEDVIYNDRYPNVDVALLRASSMRIECQRDGWTEL